MNLIALALTILGVVLLLVGLRLAAKRRKAAGLAISVLGIATAVAPFAITVYLYG